MFLDRCTVKFTAGKGGNGVISWRREKYIPKGGPFGGNGGHGASIILQASSHIFSLENFRNKSIIKAENGQSGGSKNKQGKDGKNLLILVPLGTIVKDKKTKEIIVDLQEDGQQMTLCTGGVGGHGNSFFKTSTHQAPYICTDGRAGEHKEVELELKLIADIGLLGLPNAGKSTLFSKLAKIPTKIANYPFTTLSPYLGYIEWDDFSRSFIADIPGIIENAHQNRGLGLSFLKHIERTSLLLYVIDISGFEARDPKEDFLLLQNELSSYNKELLEKPFLIVLNKIDLPGAKKHLKAFKKTFSQYADLMVEISSIEETGLSTLLELLQKKAHRRFF